MVGLLLVVGVSWLVFGGGDTTNDPILESRGAGGAELETPEAPPEPEAPTPFPPTPTPDVRTFTMAFTGDVLSHGAVIRQAEAYAGGNASRSHDYEPMFAPVAGLLSGVDLAICHLETPVSTDNVGLSGYPIFNAPRDLPAALISAGYDGCSTASNHSYDKGPAGVVSTLDQLDAAGLQHAGMSRSQDEQNAARLYQVGDVTIGHLSFTYGLNGFVLPDDQPWLVNVTEVDQVLAQAAATRAAGADYVVLSIQWGQEYVIDPTPVQLEQAAAFTASPDIDLVVGAHAHIIQPIDTVNGKTVIYGLGNFLSNQSAECCPEASQNGVIVYVEVTGSTSTGFAVSKVSFTPTRVDRTNYTVVPLPQALADQNLDPGTREIYQRALDGTTEVMNRLGADVSLAEG